MTSYSTTVGGPNRPPSKRQLLQARNDEAARRAGSRAVHQASAEAAAQEGWGSYLSRQVQERGAAVGLMGDSVDRLEGDSASWSQEVGAFVGRQKKSLIMGGEAALPGDVSCLCGVKFERVRLADDERSCKEVDWVLRIVGWAVSRGIRRWMLVVPSSKHREGLFEDRGKVSCRSGHPPGVLEYEANGSWETFSLRCEHSGSIYWSKYGCQVPSSLMRLVLILLVTTGSHYRQIGRAVSTDSLPVECQTRADELDHGNDCSTDVEPGPMTVPRSRTLLMRIKPQ